MASVRIYLESPGYVDLEIDPKDVDDEGNVNMEPYYLQAHEYLSLHAVDQ